MIYNSVFPIIVQETAKSLQAAGISKTRETPQVVVPPVGYFGMGCAGDRYIRDDFLWVNISRQLRTTQLLAHSSQEWWGETWKDKSEKTHGLK